MVKALPDLQNFKLLLFQTCESFKSKKKVKIMTFEIHAKFFLDGGKCNEANVVEEYYCAIT
jgi:hypothetical protein